MVSTQAQDLSSTTISVTGSKAQAAASLQPSTQRADLIGACWPAQVKSPMAGAKDVHEGKLCVLHASFRLISQTVLLIRGFLSEPGPGIALPCLIIIQIFMASPLCQRPSQS